MFCRVQVRRCSTATMPMYLLRGSRGMQQAVPPALNTSALRKHSKAIVDSYYERLRKTLPLKIHQDGAEHPDNTVAHALFHAPFCCCSHDGSDVFNYGNKAALALWELEWDEFVGMKSIQSADVEDAAVQAERRALLDQSADKGVVTNYSGVRMSSSRSQFRIEGATVWTVCQTMESGGGQVAMFDRVVRLNEDGSDDQTMVVDSDGNWATVVPQSMGIQDGKKYRGPV